jgi:PAS domain-containing protein
MICPILAHDKDNIGFLILGMHCPPDDEDFKIFAQTLTSTISQSATNLLLHAQLQTLQFSTQDLISRAKEAERSNAMFRHMAESATVGCAIFNPSGQPLWLNDAYIHLTGVPRENFKPGVWQQAIIPEDLPLVEQRWNALAAGEPIVPFSFRVKRKEEERRGARPGSAEALGYRWLLSNAFVDWNGDGPEVDNWDAENGEKDGERGRVKGVGKGECRRVMGWLTDISAQKWGQLLQAQRLEDALETRRQTERFIDMVSRVLATMRTHLIYRVQVSHEIRNPLSAIIQMTDGILTSMNPKNDAQFQSTGT